MNRESRVVNPVPFLIRMSCGAGCRMARVRVLCAYCGHLIPFQPSTFRAYTKVLRLGLVLEHWASVKDSTSSVTCITSAQIYFLALRADFVSYQEHMYGVTCGQRPMRLWTNVARRETK